MLKGKTTIKLMNEQGEEVYSAEESNLVTNAFNDALKLIQNNYLAFPATIQLDGNIQKTIWGINHMYNSYNKLDFKNHENYGIKLMSEHLVEDPDRYNYSKRPIAYGTNTQTIADNKGLFNNLESKQLIDDSGKNYGIRMVWDFGTSTANDVPIKCVCLAPIFNSGDSSEIGEPMCEKYSIYSLNKSFSFSHFNYYNGAKNKASLLNHNGMIFTELDGIYELYETPYVEVSETGYKISENCVRKFGISTTYSKWFRMVEIDNKYCTIAYHNDLNTYQFIEINKDDLSISNTIDLVGINDDYIDFNKCGDHHLVFVHKFQSNSINPYKVFTYDLRTHITEEITERLYPACTVVKSRKHTAGNIDRLLDNNGKFYCRISLGDSSNYSNVPSYYFNIYEDSEGNIQVGDISQSPLNAGVNSLKHGVPSCSLNGDKGGLTLYCKSSGDYYITYLTLNWSPDTLFTINNLEMPITKTAANTMKIIYELTWDNESNNL